MTDNKSLQDTLDVNASLNDFDEISMTIDMPDFKRRIAVCMNIKTGIIDIARVSHVDVVRQQTENIFLKESFEWLLQTKE